ncbi:hypothetical protein NZD89_04210 [Alicyclobacillus fastidiosus]|uniref:t-SNARE coiled-coil homology domain-containing protein n=1 Tax=Alicyclobacillus fastidiosus TaxID=392011 RepID=A0ABY6ZIQ4_9BACL|nr:hypothetical protein [Alicyclobacillus fastidiosus]WAH42655.1 hypothetical protein NZD89_04210 [Alicyclobacillus fastidiosus]GMA64531.1 hypothetical protein GCM10025859_49710 [Alicyclobacillus fastidiosus]
MGMEEKVEQIHAMTTQLISMVSSLIDRMDRLETRMDNLETRMDGLESEMTRVRTDVYDRLDIQRSQLAQNTEEIRVLHKQGQRKSSG